MQPIIIQDKGCHLTKREKTERRKGKKNNKLWVIGQAAQP